MLPTPQGLESELFKPCKTCVLHWSWKRMFIHPIKEVLPLKLGTCQGQNSFTLALPNCDWNPTIPNVCGLHLRRVAMDIWKAPRNLGSLNRSIETRDTSGVCVTLWSLRQGQKVLIPIRRKIHWAQTFGPHIRLLTNSWLPNLAIHSNCQP